MSGSAIVPKTGGLTVAWIARALSGSPLTIIDSTIDTDRNGTLADPLAAGTYAGTGANAIEVDFDGGRNGAYGPGFFSLDMRFGYAFRLGGNRRLEVSADVFNMTNRTNFDNPTGNQASAQFLLLTAYSTSYTPRKAQVGLRLEF